MRKSRVEVIAQGKIARARVGCSITAAFCNPLPYFCAFIRATEDTARAEETQVPHHRKPAKRYYDSL